MLCFGAGDVMPIHVGSWPLAGIGVRPQAEVCILWGTICLT